MFFCFLQIKSLEMAWTREDIKFLKKLPLDYSCGENHWLHRSKYWDEIFCTAITEEYNKRANKFNIAEGCKKIQGHHLYEVTVKAAELQTQYFMDRRMLGNTKSPSPLITCMACKNGKTAISEQYLKNRERLSRSFSLSDGSHKR
ncbi:hypothetical protein RND81_01G121900 [Saponaria officinalis]|uniref:Uncharacterized protein n=1 Tax=Saponaria officinalis TaxID=3572 RepID=A0AAW1N6X7_SAPOF